MPLIFIKKEMLNFLDDLSVDQLIEYGYFPQTGKEGCRWLAMAAGRVD